MAEDFVESKKDMMDSDESLIDLYSGYYSRAHADDVRLAKIKNIT